MPNVPDDNNLRKVVTHRFATHEYLVQLYLRAAEAGLVHPSEMIVAGYAWQELQGAQTVQLSVPPVEPAAPAVAEGSEGGPQEPSNGNQP